MRGDDDEVGPGPEVDPDSTEPNRAALPIKHADRLAGVHADLVAVVRLASQSVPLIVLEGVRTVERQRELYAQGRTKPGKIVTWTMNSKHLHGHAVDIAPDPLNWDDLPAFDRMAKAMFDAAHQIGVVIRWGADWDMDGKPRERGEHDSPHFEIVIAETRGDHE